MTRWIPIRSLAQSKTGKASAHRSARPGEQSRNRTDEQSNGTSKPSKSTYSLSDRLHSCGCPVRPPLRSSPSLHHHPLRFYLVQAWYNLPLYNLAVFVPVFAVSAARNVKSVSGGSKHRSSGRCCCKKYVLRFACLVVSILSMRKEDAKINDVVICNWGIPACRQAPCPSHDPVSELQV